MIAEAAFLMFDAHYQADEVHAPLVEAVPPRADVFFRKALEISAPLSTDHVVLARHVEYFACLEAPQIFSSASNSSASDKMAEVTRVQHEAGGVGNALTSRSLRQCADRHPCSRLCKTDVAVADLHEAEIRRRSAGAVAPRSLDASTPPLIVQSTPAPAHAMHLETRGDRCHRDRRYVECNCCFS